MLWGSFTSKDLGHNPGISTAAMCAMCRTFQIRAALRPTQALRRVGLAVAAPGAGRARRGVGGQGTHHLCQKFGQQLAFRPHIFCVGRWRAIPGLGQRWQPLTESCSSLLSVHLSLEQGLTSTIHGSRGVPLSTVLTRTSASASASNALALHPQTMPESHSPQASVQSLALNHDLKQFQG